MEIEIQEKMDKLKTFYNINPILELNQETDIYTIIGTYDNLSIETYVKLDRSKEDFELDAQLILIEKLHNVINKYVEWKKI
jgi:hypothetical protein